MQEREVSSGEVREGIIKAEKLTRKRIKGEEGPGQRVRRATGRAGETTKICVRKVGETGNEEEGCRRRNGTKPRRGASQRDNLIILSEKISWEGPRCRERTGTNQEANEEMILCGIGDGWLSCGPSAGVGKRVKARR